MARRSIFLKPGEQLGRKAKRGALPSPVAAPPAPPPEELEAIWEEEIREAWDHLGERQRRFLQTYLYCGNASEAYRQVYNPAASPQFASALGSRLVANDRIKTILEKIHDTRFADLLFVKRGFQEMAEAMRPNWVQDKEGQWENTGDAPDWKARKDGLDGISRIQGLYAPIESNIKAQVQSQVLIVELPAKDAAP